MLASPTGSIHDEKDKLASNLMSSSNEEEPPRRGRRERRQPTNSNDFRVEMPEFEGKLDPDEFLEWLHTVEHIFSTRMFLKTRKSSWLLLGSRSTHHYGGLTFVLRE